MPTENRSSNTEMVSDKLPPCADDVFKNGVSVCLVGDVPKHAAETICQSLSTVIGWKIDWHYIGGRTHIKALAPPPQSHPEPIAWIVGTAFWWTKEEAERDAAATGLPIIAVGPIARGFKPADHSEQSLDMVSEQHQGESVGEVVAFGTGLHEIAWAAGRMPKLGAKLYTCADPGEVERLKSIERSYGLREALLEQVKGERDRMIARTMELAGQLANQDALLHKLKETLQREYWDEYAGLDETRELIDAALSSTQEPSTPAAQYPNRLCHIDYTAHPYQCGCLKGDEEAQRRYDEHFRGASAKPDATLDRNDLIPMVDAAMVEMSNIHPPLKRSDCEKLIRAVLERQS